MAPRWRSFLMSAAPAAADRAPAGASAARSPAAGLGTHAAGGASKAAGSYAAVLKGGSAGSASAAANGAADAAPPAGMAPQMRTASSGAAQPQQPATSGKATAAPANTAAAAESRQSPERPPMAPPTAAVPGGAAPHLGHPSALLMRQHTDRMVNFLVTLVTYPFLFLLAQTAAASGAAATGGAVTRGGVGGGCIDTRQRLTDFPEGAALADLESWCVQPVFGSWWAELLIKGLRVLRGLLLTYLANVDIVVQVVNHPRALQLLQLRRSRPLPQLVDDFMPRATQLLQEGSPHLALVELQRQVLPSLAAVKGVLEQRHRLARGPTPLERLDFITAAARTGSRLFFGWLRGLARLCTYISGLLSVISGALSFTVVPSIILSVFSAGAGIGQLLLTGTADLLEPAVSGVLALTETSKDKASSFTAGSPVCARQLQPHTVEGLQAFFEHQLAAVSGLLNRPEIPRLSGPHRQLLVKAYDLGLVDANGRTEAASIRALLADAEAQGLLHILMRTAARSVAAAASLDTGALLAALVGGLQALRASVLPPSLGGNRVSLRRLFRPDGFFAYADERQAEVALVLLCRLLSWLHLSAVVAPGSADSLRFVLLLGEAQAGKASLFSRLVAAPAEYAGQLTGTPGPADGGGSSGRAGGGTDKAPASSSDALPAVPLRGRGPLEPAAAGGQQQAKPAAGPAVDLRPLAGERNMYACVLPALQSKDAAASRLATGMATAMGGVASAVVFLVHPGSSPSPDKLALLEGPLAAGRHCLVAINGPGRVRELAQADGGGGNGTEGAGVPEGVLAPSSSSALEGLRARWQAAAEAFCAGRGLNPSLLGVVVSDVLAPDADAAAGGGGGVAGGGGGEVPPGVHKFKQMREWIVSTANQAHRMA